MNQKYRELFYLIARSSANIGEQVMNMHLNQHEEIQAQTAEKMRDDFIDLADKFDAKTFDSEKITKSDYARLLVGTIIIVNQVENRIKSDQKALEGYKLDVLPKLDQINNAENDEAAMKLAAELFEIKETAEPEPEEKE